MAGPSLSELYTLLNELESVSPGSGAIHDYNNVRTGLKWAIEMYGRPGRERTVANEYQRGQSFLISIRRRR